jgi:hypothetical protein
MKLGRTIRSLPLVVLVLGVVSLFSGAAAAAAAFWTVVPSPSPSAQANYLSAVATVTSNDAWAVGAWYRQISTPGTLTEHWNGTQWTVVPSPNATAGYNELYGVDAVASNDVWAVGYHNIANYGTEKTMALHWNGSSWKIVPTQNIGPDANLLLGVAAVATNDVWAVGFGSSTDATDGVPLAQHWNGSGWKLSRTPSLGGGFAALNGVTALASNDVWAVGHHDGDTLIEHWNGASWSIVPSPNGSRSDSELYAVSALAPNDVWAVGETSDFNHSSTLVEHWDGTSWTVVASRNGTKPKTALNGVLALGPNDVWAVGTTYDDLTVVFRTFTEHWDGTSWTVVASPNPSPEYDFLQGIGGVPGGQLWSVGAADTETLAIRGS